MTSNRRLQPQRTVCIVRSISWQNEGVFALALSSFGYETLYFDALVTGELTQRELDCDLVIVLGGPNGAEDTLQYPRLGAVFSLITHRLKHDKPILGICLGAQLMANVLGAKVWRMCSAEIGLGQLELTDAAAGTALADRAQAGPVLHWHQDTFDLPKGAIHLARTSLCENQAFAYGSSALALQCHIEPDPNRFEEWLVGNSYQLSTLKIDPRDLRARMQEQNSGFARAGEQFLHTWLRAISNPKDSAQRQL